MCFKKYVIIILITVVCLSAATNSTNSRSENKVDITSREEFEKEYRLILNQGQRSDYDFSLSYGIGDLVSRTRLELAKTLLTTLHHQADYDDVVKTLLAHKLALNNPRFAFEVVQFEVVPVIQTSG